MERSGKRVDSGPCGDNWLLTVYFFAITSLCMKCIISIEKKEVSLSSWESRQGNDGEGNLEEKPYIYPVRDRFDIWSIFGFWIYIYIVSSSLNRNLSSSTRRIVPGKTDRKFLETDRKRGGGGEEKEDEEEEEEEEEEQGFVLERTAGIIAESTYHAFQRRIIPLRVWV